MAKGTAWCTCAKCGAQFKVEAVKRNRDEANRWEVWAVSYYDECPECYKARKAEEREAEAKAAAEKYANLPALSGTEKQISWATTIRQRRITSIGSGLNGVYEVDDKLRAYLEWLIAEKTSSRFWIDTRDESDFDFVKKTATEYAERQ